MKILKNMLDSLFLIFIGAAAIGVLLIIDPTIFTRIISYVIGGLALAFGALKLISFFAGEREEPEIISAVVLCITGIFIIARPDFIFNILAFVFGLLLLGEGLISIKRASMLRDYTPENWVMPIIIVVLTTVLGLIIMLNPFIFAKMTMRILGVLLIISAIFSIFNGMITKRQIKRIEKSEKTEYIDIE